MTEPYKGPIALDIRERFPMSSFFESPRVDFSMSITIDAISSMTFGLKNSTDWLASFPDLKW